MSNNQIQLRVLELVAKALNIEKISPDASQENVAEWDSLAYLSVLAGIEDEFDLEISQENINNFGSITDIVKEIDQCDCR